MSDYPDCGEPMQQTQVDARVELSDSGQVALTVGTQKAFMSSQTAIDVAMGLIKTAMLLDVLKEHAALLGLQMREEVEILENEDDDGGVYYTMGECPECGGSGKLTALAECPICHGIGGTDVELDSE